MFFIYLRKSFSLSHKTRTFYLLPTCSHIYVCSELHMNVLYVQKKNFFVSQNQKLVHVLCYLHAHTCSVLCPVPSEKFFFVSKNQKLVHVSIGLLSAENYAEKMMRKMFFFVSQNQKWLDLQSRFY
jgi:hypothetical protein